MAQTQTFLRSSDYRGRLREGVAADIAWLEVLIANVVLVGRPGSSDWVLVDTGIRGFAGRIARAAARRFGPFAPKAIILTHGHFDHVGTLRALLNRWVCPVYAHALELPYIAGRVSYPPPDPTVGGGVMTRLSPMYPNRGESLGGLIQPLPPDGAVPHLPGWRWIHTPGHTPGHISLFRDDDRSLIAGDAFTTRKQESLLAVVTNHQQIHGPPAYFTMDWEAAHRSVRVLAELEPESAITGHGIPMQGPSLRSELHRLADRFVELAVPRRGRYVGHPAVADAHGVVSMPPALRDPLPGVLASAAIGFTLGRMIGGLRHSRPWCGR